MQARQLAGVWQFSFQGRIGKRKDGRSTLIMFSKAHAQGFSTTHWGKATLDESVFTATPTDLCIKDVFKARRDKPNWLTPNTGLDPIVLSTQSWTGQASVRRKRPFTLVLPTGESLTTDLVYQYDQGPTSRVRTEESVVRLKHARGPQDVRHAILPALDDLLAIASFATRQSRVCVGWTTVHDDGIVQYYRRDIVIPEEQEDRAEAIIQRQDLHEFVRKAYRRFQEPLGGNVLIRLALYKSIPKKPETIEQDFLALFGAIETLCLYFCTFVKRITS